MGQYNEELAKAGVLLAAKGCSRAARARACASRATRTVIDGPFTETKELIAGFWLWQVKSKGGHRVGQALPQPDAGHRGRDRNPPAIRERGLWRGVHAGAARAGGAPARGAAARSAEPETPISLFHSMAQRMLAALDNFTFRPLVRSDLPMFHEWLQRPHVAEWWSYPRTVAEVELEYLPVVLGQSTTRAYIAVLHGQPIGFDPVVRSAGLRRRLVGARSRSRCQGHRSVSMQRRPIEPRPREPPWSRPSRPCC